MKFRTNETLSILFGITAVILLVSGANYGSGTTIKTGVSFVIVQLLFIFAPYTTPNLTKKLNKIKIPWKTK